MNHDEPHWHMGKIWKIADYFVDKPSPEARFSQFMSISS